MMLNKLSNKVFGWLDSFQHLTLPIHVKANRHQVWFIKMRQFWVETRSVPGSHTVDWQKCSSPPQFCTFEIGALKRSGSHFNPSDTDRVWQASNKLSG